MVEYLGQIGNNQHKVLPTNGFNKKSYPLPRDIIARTLAHMKDRDSTSFNGCTKDR